LSQLMYEPKDFVDSWQFRTLMVGSFVAAFGIVVCVLGVYTARETLCTLGVPTLYVGVSIGVFGIGAGVLTLGWNSILRRLDRDR
jgi:hypothetical protein